MIIVIIWIIDVYKRQGVTDLLIRDLDAEKENKEDSQVRVEYDDIWTIEYGKWLSLIHI